MSDARALLKAKRQEARVSHPLAGYTSAGQLRCVACGTNVKHTSSWEGHVGSKGHRVNAARLRETQQMEVERQRMVMKDSGKRKAEDEDDEDMAQEESSTKKRKLSPVEARYISAQTTALTTTSDFPADFFSDPSHAPPPLSSDDEGEEEMKSRSTLAQAAPLDAEWEAFQQTVLNAPDKGQTYDRATVFAEPVLAAEVPEGFPPREGGSSMAETEAAPLTETEIRRNKEQEERELIMDRLMQEERAQEEADAKVSMLKQRLKSLRKHREAAKTARESRDKES